MTAELTTLVWERVCVCCGASTLVRRHGRLYCGGCSREMVRVSKSDGWGQPQDLQMVARQALRALENEEAFA